MLRLSPRLRRRRGFTLLELLVAVTVIGTLAALIFPRMMGVKKGAYTDLARNSLRNLAVAQENLHANEGRIASNIDDAALNYLPDEDVVVRVEQVFPDKSWWGSAEHISRPDSYCFLALGKTTPPGYVSNKIICPQ